MKYFFYRYKLFLIASVLLLIAILSVLFNTPDYPKKTPLSLPPQSPFKKTIGGIGIIEPSTGNIRIGTNIAGIVSQVNVATGQQIKKGDILFTIDDRDTRSELELAEAKLQAAKIQLANAQYQQSLYDNVQDKRAISKDELSSKRFATELAKANVNAEKANYDLLITRLERLNVRSPISASVLKMNVHPGEYASIGELVNPLIVLGNMDRVHVRVEIDESDALRISPESKAFGFIRGHTNKSIPLTFVQFEPLIIPKKSFTNASNEIVDTRVLQVIYELNNQKIGAFDGQHIDVFIAARSNTDGER